MSKEEEGEHCCVWAFIIFLLIALGLIIFQAEIQFANLIGWIIALWSPLLGQLVSVVVSIAIIVIDVIVLIWLILPYLKSKIKKEPQG